MRSCPPRVFRRQLIQPRIKALSGPFFQPANGLCANDQGNAFGIGGPLAGPKATRAWINEGEPSFVHIRFTQPIQLNGACTLPFGMTVTADGAEMAITAVVQQDGDTVLRLTVTPDIDPGEAVAWTYTEGTPGCIQESGAEANDPGIGDQGPLMAQNDLVLEGELILLETGGKNIILLEDDINQSSGIQLETAT